MPACWPDWTWWGIAFLLNDVLSAEVDDLVHAICAHYGILCVDLKGIAK